MKAHSVVIRDDEIVKEEESILIAFTTTFVPLRESSTYLQLSEQYARRKVLAYGIEGRDYYNIDGRIYVSADFLQVLKEQ